MGFLKETWEGFTNYLGATKEEVKKEWDEFQEEIDETSAYAQSTTSDILQQTSNGLSFVAEAAGSVINNSATRALASETLEDIGNSQMYHDISENLSEVSTDIAQEVNTYLDENPELKAQLYEAGQSIDDKIDAGISYAKEVAKEHPEALRNIGAIGAVVAAVVPAAKGAKLLNKAEHSLVNEYILSPEQNRKRFEEKILPELKDKFDFTSQENPTLHFTGGLPGAGKSGIVDEIQSKHELPQILIADPDKFREYHPKIYEIQEKFGPDASIITHPDASMFAKHTMNEALDNNINIIKDGTLNNAQNLENLVTTAKAKGFEQEITIKAVNEYASLEGVFKRYANQYADKPSEARFVPPSYVKESKIKIEETAERIKDLDVKAFKVIDRENTLIYDQALHPNASAKEMMQEATHLKNYPKEKIEALEQNWDATIDRLKEVNAPQNVQQSAKEIRHELATELHPIKARVMTKETGVVVGGVATYVGADKLHESVQPSNTLDQEVLEQRVDKQTHQTLPIIEIEDRQSISKEVSHETFNIDDVDFNKYLPQHLRSTNVVSQSYDIPDMNRSIDTTNNLDNYAVDESQSISEAEQRIYDYVEQKYGNNDDYGNAYDVGMEID
jgi:hypothetical protein